MKALFVRCAVVTGLYVSLLFPPAAAAEPMVLFQDRFDSISPGSSPAVPPWSIVNSDDHADHEATVREDGANLFGRGVSNHYLEFRDSSPKEAGENRGSLQMTALNALHHEVVTLSFRVHEPRESGEHGEQLTIQLLAGTGTRISGNRAQVFRLRNGAFLGNGTANVVFGEGSTRRFDFVMNNSAAPVTYAGGQVLGSGLADIWLDGELVIAGYSFAREAGAGPIRSVDFSTFLNHNQRIFLDDITVFEGAVVNAPFDSARAPVAFPLRLQRDKEPSELFGYFPEYTQNVPSFDGRNRPYIRSRGEDIDETSFVHTIESGRWVALDFIEAVRAAVPGFQRTYRGGGRLTERVVFDEQDRAYMYLKVELTTGGYRNLVMMSTDYCRTWQVVDTRVNGGDFAIEHNVGHNRLEGPPFMLLSRRQAAPHPDPWAAYHEFHIAQPRIANAALSFPGTRHVNDLLLSIGQHSGGSSFSVTHGGKTHFTWIEVTDDNVPGTPTYAATYDHATGALSPKVLVAYAPPRNNSHNRPGMVMDSEGYLHIVTGSHHGQNFYHTRSLQPHSVSGGWSTPEPVWGSGWRATNGEDRGGQTYVSLVCDSDDTLHLVFRQWRHSDELFSQGSYYAALSYQRKPKGGSWMQPRVLVLPEGDQYSVYYQKLAIDRIGRLFLSFSHFNWTMDEAEDSRFQRRMVILSDDGGENWRLAETADFLAGWLPASYVEWRDQHFDAEERLDPLLSGPGADPGGVGLPNLLRYALGLDPRANERTRLPLAWSQGEALVIEYDRRIHAQDLVYRVEVSDNLVDWVSGPGEVEEVELNRGGGFVRIRATDATPANGARQRFMRLVVELR
jgi:hypothetical protein